jgi:Fe2+ transport system protein B
MAEEKTVKDEQVSELDDEVTRNLFQEIKQGFRDWEFDGIKYRTRYPVSKEENDANWEFSKSFNRAMKEGLPTTSEMDKMLRERGLWSNADDEMIDSKREKIGQLEIILAKKDSKDSSKPTFKLASELSELRNEIVEKSGEYQRYMSQTVESKADEARTAYLVAVCTETVDGESVWESVDKFLTDKRAGLVNTATYHYITFTAGLAQDYIEQLTETKFIRAGRDVKSD